MLSVRQVHNRPNLVLDRAARRRDRSTVGTACGTDHLMKKEGWTKAGRPTPGGFIPR